MWKKCWRLRGVRHIQQRRTGEQRIATSEDTKFATKGVAWLWPVIVPVIPVLLAIPLLQFVGLPNIPVAIAPGMLAADGTAILQHSSARIVFAASVALHTGVCLSALIYFWLVLRRTASLDFRPIVAAVLLTGLGVMGAMVWLSQVSPPLVAYRMTYFAIDALLRASTLAADLAGSAPPGSLSPLAIAVLYPSALGVISVIMAAGIACALLRRIGLPHADGWAASFHSNIKILFRCFYVLSLVLVTSTVAALLFFQLPVGLVSIKSAPPGFAAALAGYAGSLATFWGAIYTLTLFSVFVGPLAILYARARRHVENHADGQDLSGWLSDHGINSSMAGNVKNLIVLVAPLLVGPIGDLTQALA